MALLKDIWRIGMIRAPREAVLAPGALERLPIQWVDNPGALRFLADPFGLWRDGRFYLFAETYDYRDRVGAIDVLTFDADLRLIRQQPALREPWHLSYPFLIEADGKTYMLPEAFKSGGLTLYRAVDFPARWEPVQRIVLDEIPIDATPVFHDGRWWLFYTPATTKAAKVGALHVAWADRLTGPWTPHAGNPVRLDPSSSRPGGTPFVRDGLLVLPVQDCRRTYGGALRLLTISVLTPERFEAEAADALSPPAGFSGLHTLSVAGDVTLIDAKRQVAGPRSLWLDARRAVRKAAARCR